MYVCACVMCWFHQLIYILVISISIKDICSIPNFTCHGYIYCFLSDFLCSTMTEPAVDGHPLGK